MEKFSDGEKDETDWEEIIVYANFEAGTIDKEIFQQSDLKFKIIGLDSDTPVVQLGDSTYKGRVHLLIIMNIYPNNYINQFCQ